MSAWRTIRTKRLLLQAPTDDDLAAVHDLYRDTRVWRHVPRARHTTTEQTRALVEAWQREWQAAGLGQWLVRTPSEDAVLGNVGCAVRDSGSWWSLSYRLHPDAQGQGFAGEAGRAAIEAAHDVAPDRPVIASLLEHNAASRAVVERLGLELAFRGPDRRNPDLGGTRLLFSDRPLTDSTMNLVVGPSH